MRWSDLHFINLKISGSSLEDGLELGEMGYRANSKLGARNKEMGTSKLRGSVSLEIMNYSRLVPYWQLDLGPDVACICWLSPPDCPGTHKWKVVGIP